MSNALLPRRHERHPVGLLVIIGLHVLLALAMLYARLQVDLPPTSRATLANVDLSPQQLQSHDLPSAPAAPLRQIVVPVPEVVVDRPAAIVASPQEAPPASAPSTGAGAPAASDDGAVSAAGREDGAIGAAGNGAGAGAGGLVAPRPAYVYANAPQCQPVYPTAARLHNVAGTTRLHFTVDATGRIVDVKLLRRSGQMAENFLMDRAAMDSLAHCPATAGIDESGHAAGGTTDINYIWLLN